MAESERVTVRLTPQLRNEIDLQLMIHNGRSNMGTWDLSEFLRRAAIWYLNELRRKRDHSARRAFRRKVKRQEQAQAQAQEQEQEQEISDEEGATHDPD